MPRLIFTSLIQLMRGLQLAPLQGELFLCQSDRFIPEDKRPAFFERFGDVSFAPRDCVSSENRWVAAIPAYANTELNVTSTPNTRRFAVRQSSPTQSESHYPNSHGRVNSGRNTVQKRTHQGIQALNQAGASNSFAQLIYPNFLTSAYPCSLRVGVGMKSR